MCIAGEVRKTKRFYWKERSISTGAAKTGKTRYYSIIIVVVAGCQMEARRGPQSTGDPWSVQPECRDKDKLFVPLGGLDEEAGG
jgi:hypothetical protein